VHNQKVKASKTPPTTEEKGKTKEVENMPVNPVITTTIKEVLHEEKRKSTSVHNQPKAR